MNLPFTPEQFLAVFSNYNSTVWPVQILLNAIAAGAVALAIWKTKISDRLIGLALAMMWLWMGIVYHWMFFSTINKAAYLFGSLFVVQGLLILWLGPIRNRLSFRATAGGRGIAGVILFLYAMVVYPVIGAALGHSYPESPTFGLPCPTTIFTFGMLLWTDRRLPVLLMVIPVLWSVVGFMAALLMGIREDAGLLVAGLVTLIWILLERRAPRAQSGTAI